MKIFIILIVLFFIKFAHGETLCWKSKVDDKHLAYMKVEPAKVDRRSDGNYVKICIKLANPGRRLQYAGGGQSGGNSKFGSNFLVLNDYLLELTNEVPEDDGLEPWTVLVEKNDDDNRLIIAKDIVTAKSILSQRTDNQRVLMSDNFSAVATNVIRFQLNRETTNDAELLKQFDERILNDASKLQIDVRHFENTDVQALRLNVQE